MWSSTILTASYICATKVT